MREIKFRVYDLDNQKFMYYDHDAGFDNFKFWDIINDFEHGDIQQYVGLMDMNRVEIYEGDILSGVDLYNYEGPYIGTVEYIPCRYHCSVKYPNGGNGGIILDSREIDEHQLKVVGNIYENPELLNTNPSFINEFILSRQ